MKLRIRQFLKLTAPAVFVVVFLLTASPASAQCSSVGQCVGNKTCVCVSGCGSSVAVIVPGDVECGSSDLGQISAPQGVLDYNLKINTTGIGIFGFLSVILRIITIGAGLWTVGNFIFSGVRLISAFGDPKAYTDIKEKIQWSMVGLVVIAASYTIAGLLGLLFFGDPTFLLHPQIQGAIPTP